MTSRTASEDRSEPTTSRNLIRLLLIPVLCLAGAAAGYFFPASQKADLIAKSAWPVLLMLILVTGWVATPLFRKLSSRRFFTRNWMLILIAAALVFLYSVNDHRKSKIIHDELLIQGTALGFLQDGEYRIPQFSHNLLIDYEIVGGVPDKRPPLFPFLLSICHKVLGYHQTNGFLLNGMLGFLLLFLIGKIGQMILPGMGGIIGMVAFSTLPLLSQNITGQHLEVLYLALIATLILVSFRIVRGGCSGEVVLSYLIAVLIAMTRYEGLIFMIVPFLVHSYLVVKRGYQGKLTVLYWVLPLAMAFNFCLIGHVFEHPEFWQLDDMGNDTAFSIAYWRTNTGAMLDLLFRADRSLPNSLALSTFGVASVIVMVGILGNRIKRLFAQAPDELTEEAFLIGLFMLAGLLFFMLIFSYHWGFVNSHATARFILFPYLVSVLTFLHCIKHRPYLLLALSTGIAALTIMQVKYIDEDPVPIALIFVFAGAAVIFALVRARDRVAILQPMLLGLFSVFFVSETLSAIAQKKYELDAIPMKRADVFLSWIHQRQDDNAIFISDSSLYGVVSRVSSTNLKRFEMDTSILLDLKKERKFTDIFVLQMFRLMPSGDIEILDQWKLPGEFDYEIVEWRRLNDSAGVRMLRLLEEGSVEAAESSVPEQSPFEDQTGKE